MLDAEVGQSIRLHRKNAKMTLQGLADRLGIAYQQVQKYETGVNRVGAGRLMEIAEILNVPVASFFDTPHLPGEDGAPAVAHSEAAVHGRQVMVASFASRIRRSAKPHSTICGRCRKPNHPEWEGGRGRRSEPGTPRVQQ